jgi:hypothetical protein
VATRRGKVSLNAPVAALAAQMDGQPLSELWDFNEALHGSMRIQSIPSGNELRWQLVDARR